MAFLYGPVLEEPGWRGFALPLLQQRWGPLAGSVVLGLAWAFWHAPQLLTDSFSAANGGGTLTGTAVFIVSLVCVSILITWAYNHTGGSVLIAILIHTSVNYTQAVSSDLFPAAGYNEVAPTAAFAVLAIVLVLVTRGRLGLPNASVQQPGHDAR
jgi:uncharacterized protein